MEPETIQHLFWDCIYINPLLGEFISWIRNICSENFVLIASEMILGKTNASVIQNCLMILLKFYIYQHRLKKNIPDFTGFVIYVKYYQKLEIVYITTTTKFINIIIDGQNFCWSEPS